jgi:hypothetical protein
MSKSIINEIEANGWTSRTWGGQLVASKSGHELTISGSSARWYGPYAGGGTVDNGIVDGVRSIVSILKEV